MKTYIVALFGLLALVPSPATGQVVSSLGSVHGLTVQAITATADLVPEDLYDFRPNDDVRTLGQILAHIADANYSICSAAAGQDSPSPQSIEQSKTSKADIKEALAQAFSHCENIYASMSDEKATETTPFLGGQPLARAAILAFNSAHNYEHYGNLVTYMRINGITPPTSTPQQ